MRSVKKNVNKTGSGITKKTANKKNFGLVIKSIEVNLCQWYNY